MHLDSRHMIGAKTLTGNPCLRRVSCHSGQGNPLMGAASASLTHSTRSVMCRSNASVMMCSGFFMWGLSLPRCVGLPTVLAVCVPYWRLRVSQSLTATNGGRLCALGSVCSDHLWWLIGARCLSPYRVGVLLGWHLGWDIGKPLWGKGLKVIVAYGYQLCL